MKITKVCDIHASTIKKRLTRIPGSAVAMFLRLLFAGNLLVAVYSAVAKFLFDAEELVVFCHTV